MQLGLYSSEETKKQLEDARKGIGLQEFLKQLENGDHAWLLDPVHEGCCDECYGDGYTGSGADKKLCDECRGKGSKQGNWFKSQQEESK